jgi:hypothetical protein
MRGWLECKKIYSIEALALGANLLGRWRLKRAMHIPPMRRGKVVPREFESSTYKEISLRGEIKSLFSTNPQTVNLRQRDHTRSQSGNTPNNKEAVN